MQIFPSSNDIQEFEQITIAVFMHLVQKLQTNQEDDILDKNTDTYKHLLIHTSVILQPQTLNGSSTTPTQPVFLHV